MSKEKYIKLDDALKAVNECRCSDCTNEQTLGCELCQFDDCYKKLLKVPALEINRATALSVLKEFSRDMYPSNDIFGKPTLVMSRKAFEAIRKKYLDTDYCERSEFEKIATKIFDEIEASIAVHAFTNKSDDYAEGAFDTIEFVDSKIDELRKKYIGGRE